MKRCKSCGRSLRIEDRISQLPEALLLQILSLLPTKDSVSTSVLSKQWRSLWKMLPNLKFKCGTNDIETFSDNVCRALLSHQAPVLRSLHLVVGFDEGESMDLGVLLGIAFGLHVRKLKLEVSCEDEEGPFRFPRSLYNCETLESLELKASCGSILVEVPSLVCLKLLRTLHLHEVSYEDDESVVSLLSGCFHLENLVVNRNGHDDVKTFVIAVPSLQRLTIIDEFESAVYVINCPSLKYLKIEGRYGIGSCLIENAPELVEAYIDIDINDVIIENILGSLTSVKRLSLKISPLEVPFPTGSIFYRLLYLELCTYKTDWWNLLTLMLEASPKLISLKLIGFMMSQQWDSEIWEKWNQPKNVPECLLLHLETFVWTCLEGETEDEKEVAKYILRNASRLKTTAFSKLKCHPKKRVEIIEELESVVRASNSCQLLFK